MGIHGEVSELYQTFIESQNLRMVRYPAAIAGFNLVSDGAAAATAYCANYIQVVAAATVANPIWIAGIVLGTPQVEAFYGDIKIATGAVGFEVDLVPIPVGTDLFPVVEWGHPIIWLPSWIKVIGSPRIAANIRKSTAASAAGYNNCAVLAFTGIGT